MENNVTQRFREFMGSTGLSILAFANAIGIPQSTLNQQLNGRNGKNIGVQISVITATLSAYPNLVGKLSGHKENSRAFARYRDIDEDMAKELVEMLE